MPLSVEAQYRLRLLGLKAIGDFAALPADTIAIQLGANSVTAHRLANGVDNRSINPRQRSRSLSEERQFTDPPRDSEQLTLTLVHLVDQLLPRLQGDYLFCQKVEVGLTMESGEVHELSAYLRVPTQDGGVIVRAAQRLILGALDRSGIMAINLSLANLGLGQSKQLSFFAPRQGRLDKLAGTVAQLQSRLGDGRLRRAVVRDAEAFLPERRFAFVEYQ
ncbi:MAG: hypothetical protein M0Z94_20540 [Dehalococcoidales bacterium]|nr:hypothetical protein [Dehalococcoidales bacterium]